MPPTVFTFNQPIFQVTLVELVPKINGKAKF